MAVVVRAHNEEDTVAMVVATLRATSLVGGSPLPGDGRVWVAASGCTDGTVRRAEAAGAAVIVTPLGLGASVRTVLTAFRSEPVVFVDADLTHPRGNVVRVLLAAARAGFVGKGAMDRAGRSSALLPALAREAGVVLPDIPPQALTSAYSSYPAGFADLVDLSVVPDGRGSDLMLSLLAHRAGLGTVVVPAGPREHRDRGAGHIDLLVAGNRETLAAFASAYPPAGA